MLPASGIGYHKRSFFPRSFGFCLPRYVSADLAICVWGVELFDMQAGIQGAGMEGEVRASDSTREME